MQIYTLDCDWIPAFLALHVACVYTHVSPASQSLPVIVLSAY